MEDMLKFDDVELYYDLGLIHGEAGDEEKAVDIMREVLERDPDHASALNYVGYTWADKGVRLEEAEGQAGPRSWLRTKAVVTNAAKAAPGSPTPRPSRARQLIQLFVELDLSCCRSCSDSTCCSRQCS